MLQKRPSPSLIVAIVAVVLACAGSATAASMITGQQIRNGSVTGLDIKDGSISVKDVAPGMRAATAGPAGPAGARGADGANGARGAEGPAGPAGPAGARGADGFTGLQRVDGPAYTAPNALGTYYFAEAVCPNGKVPVGGGGGATGWGGTSGQIPGEVIFSGPDGSDGWLVKFRKDTMTEVTVRAYVYCATA